MLREVIKKNQIPVASSLVDRAVEMQYQRLRQMLGMKPERGNPGLTDDLKDKMRPAGADEVRGQLLLEAIADKEGISVTDEELTKHIEATAKGRNVAPAKLRAEWQRDGRIDNVTYSLRQDKVLRFLVDNASVTEVEKLSQAGTPLPDVPRRPSPATFTAPTAITTTESSSAAGAPGTGASRSAAIWLGAMETDPTEMSLTGERHPTIAELKDPSHPNISEHLASCAMCRSVVDSQSHDHSEPIPLDLPKGLVTEAAFRWPADPMARGGMAQIFAGEDRRLARPVILKAPREGEIYRRGWPTCSSAGSPPRPRSWPSCSTLRSSRSTGSARPPWAGRSACSRRSMASRCARSSTS